MLAGLQSELFGQFELDIDHPRQSTFATGNVNATLLHVASLYSSAAKDKCFGVLEKPASLHPQVRTQARSDRADLPPMRIQSHD